MFTHIFIAVVFLAIGPMIGANNSKKIKKAEAEARAELEALKAKYESKK